MSVNLQRRNLLRQISFHRVESLIQQVSLYIMDKTLGIEFFIGVVHIVYFCAHVYRLVLSCCSTMKRRRKLVPLSRVKIMVLTIFLKFAFIWVHLFQNIPNIITRQGRYLVFSTYRSNNYLWVTFLAEP